MIAVSGMLAFLRKASLSLSPGRLVLLPPAFVILAVALLRQIFTLS